MRRHDDPGRLGLALKLVRVASLIVPGRLRREWLREWTGELWAVARGGRSATGPALGSFRHAAWLRWEEWRAEVAGWARDLHVAARTLRRRPAFALTAVATLAIGIGASTAVYTVVDGVLLAPLPYPGAERWVRVRASVASLDMTGRSLNPELFTEWRRRTRALEAMEAYSVQDVNLVGGGSPAVVRGARVTGGFLRGLLAAEPLLGRLTEPAEHEAGGDDVVLISERLWRNRFGAAPDAVGSTVRADGRPVTVIGVLPQVALLPEVDVWLPHPPPSRYGRSYLGALNAIGRMGPGVTLDEALEDLRAAAAGAGAEYPESLAPFTPELADYRSPLISDVRAHLLLLMGAVGALLLIACVNVANLVLARAVERQGETDLRRCLGASRWHLVSHGLAEALILALLGGGAGTAVAVLSVDGLLALVPAEIPLAASVSVDVRVLAFAAALTLGVALLVGLLPALRAGGSAAAAALPSRGASATRGQRRAGEVLLGLEVAHACALLVAGGLMVNTLWRMSTADAGFDPDGLLFVHLHLPDYAYEDADARRRFLDELTSRLHALPPVRSVGVGTATPFSGMTFVTGARLEGGMRPGAGDSGIRVSPPYGEQRELADFSRIHVSPEYLETLRLDMVLGRGLRAGDLTASDAVAVVNETAARAYWPGESPLGKRLREGGEGQPWTTVVGVVEDFAHPGLEATSVATLYRPLSSYELPAVRRPMLLVRYDAPSDGIVEQVRRTVWEVDPELPIPAVATATQELGARLAVPRFYAVLLGLFAGLALLLAAVGTYGVMAHAVARRTREIGIRLAVGATAGRVRRAILREGMRVVVVGVVAGLLVAAAASRAMEGLLYGVAPVDPWTYGAVGLFLAAVAALAMWAPARRAMRADPVEALRAD